MKLTKSSMLESKELTLGFMALTDCAPIVIAKELGFFSNHGLEVTLEKQFSWATMRDKLHAGVIDAAQLLAPMPLASSLGLGGLEPTHVIAPLVLSRNGNAITISESLYQELLALSGKRTLSLPLSASLLTPIIEKRKLINKKLIFGTVFPHSCHYYQLLSWLESSNIDSSDIDIVIVSPTKMVEALTLGVIDGFCVGGPYNAKSVREGVGFTGIVSSDIWPNVPEKVLGLLQTWYEEKPNTTHAHIASLQQACHWLSLSANRYEAARFLAQPHYIDIDIETIVPSMLESCLVHSTIPSRDILSYNQFSAHHDVTINQPDHFYGEWLLNCMIKTGQLNEHVNTPNMIEKIFRQDIFNTALSIQF